MTYEEALAYWFARVDYEKRTPGPGDFKLDRMRLLLRALGEPERRFRIVHVAGTKGKGSTSVMLAAALRREGYRVGLFTSPHLDRVEERIQVDGDSIGPSELAARIAEIRSVANAVRLADGTTLGPTLTFFEIGTALGFLHFAYRRVDWACVEVGLGGRLDCTNVCLPEASLITSISFDHMETLGDTLAKIAGEKAGIVKPGRPTLSGVPDGEAADVIAAVCRAVGSPLRRVGVDYRYRHAPARIGAVDSPGRADVTTWRNTYSLTLPLVGEHQAANAALATATLECLRERGLAIRDASIVDGIAEAAWPARLETLSKAPLVLLDCAHNVASAEALRDALAASYPVEGQRTLIFAVSRDKDAPGILRVLAPAFDRVVLTRFEGNPRAASPEALASAMPSADAHKVVRADAPASAAALARGLLGSRDLLCVTGSVFLCAEIRRHLV